MKTDPAGAGNDLGVTAAGSIEHGWKWAGGAQSQTGGKLQFGDFGEIRAHQG